MGQELVGKCVCGLEKEVYVGSGRQDHGKKFNFPHYCNSCHSLITVDILQKKYSCTDCGSSDIHSYAALTKTIPSDSEQNSWPDAHLAKLGFHKRKLVEDETYCATLDKDFVLFRFKNHCPVCNLNSLTFTISADYD